MSLEFSFYRLGVLVAVLPAIGWSIWCVWPVRQKAILASAIWTGAYVVLWQALVIALDVAGLPGFRVFVAQVGLAGLFAMGLCWVIWWLERWAQFYEQQRVRAHAAFENGALQRFRLVHGDVPPLLEEGRIWNPLDPECFLYSRHGKRLHQSMAALTAYTVLFFAAFLASTMIGGCREAYEMPAGGGEQQALAQVIKVQKVVRKKFVINPFSAIVFEVPPIEEINLQIEQITAHTYVVGQGAGSGQAGFGAGTNTGEVRFIRLEYPGGDWNQDFGVGADLNMLIEYGIRTKHKVAKRTESRTVAALKRFELYKSPPVIYLTGSRNISLSSSDIKVLREYLLEKHGMIFGDNGGSRHFHNQFVQMMAHVLPKVRPVTIPLDDPIHRIPYAIPFLPYVVAHGGSEALGWKVDGRWVCYYHPGDVGDAWSDGHAGVEKRIAEYCYQLGTNVIFYAHAEYSKWVQAQKQED